MPRGFACLSFSRGRENPLALDATMPITVRSGLAARVESRLTARRAARRAPRLAPRLVVHPSAPAHALLQTRSSLVHVLHCPTKGYK